MLLEVANMHAGMRRNK